ncbi:hypothetical protein [Serratia sp. (in: enterobacteria)]|uniref:hypothetical protein n=1 Tax=Serratia sp. (in: enterobacteria) TaxID=616 RepID=UPI0028BEA061|nr:hypothetical protein [Serratia sp. (in: enterobacteria)]
MCEPTTIIAGASLALAAVSAYGQVQQGRQQAKIANANADAQEIAARDTINAGNAEAAQQRQQTRQLQGQQAAAFGAGGTDMTSGSALNIFGDTAAGGQLDALTTINNSINQSNSLAFQADVTRTQAKIDRQQSNLGAFTTILNTPLKAFGAYKTFGGDTSIFSSAGKATGTGGTSGSSMFDNMKKSNTALIGNTGFKGPYTF